MFRVMMNGLDVEALARGEKNLVGDASVAQTTLQYEVVRRTRWWDLSGEIATIDGPSAVCYEEHDAHGLSVCMPQRRAGMPGHA